MQNRNNERWLRPCDLCGSLDYEPLEGPSLLHRCRGCGLVQRAEECAEQTPESRIDAGLFETTLKLVLKQITRRTDGQTMPSLLIIGRPPETTLPLLRESLLYTTLLVGYNETAGLEGIPIQTGGIEEAPFRPEQFDVILCAKGMESLDSAGTLFAKARLWLAPEGLFFVGGANWGSLTRRLWSRRWRERHRTGHIFVDREHPAEYAARHGFKMISRGTRSRIEETAMITFDLSAPSLLATGAALPIWIASSLPGLGETWWSLLSKRGFAVRPILRRREEEAERAPGLAAAGYGSASRQRIEAE